MIITADIFEAFLKCPTKCYLRSVGEVGIGNPYADWLRTQKESCRSEGIKRLNFLRSFSVMFHRRLRSSCSTAFCRHRSRNSHSALHAQFMPIRFVLNYKLSLDDKLLLAFDAR